MITITDKPIEVQTIIDSVASNDAGAVNVFIGTVRNTGKGKEVSHLEYEAYEPMASSEIQKIIAEALKRWPIAKWAISHRTGLLKPGEVSVVVAVSLPHRKESFEACQYIIDTLKAKAPIWKKEVYPDGSDWISSTP